MSRSRVSKCRDISKKFSTILSRHFHLHWMSPVRQTSNITSLKFGNSNLSKKANFCKRNSKTVKEFTCSFQGKWEFQNTSLSKTNIMKKKSTISYCWRCTQVTLLVRTKCFLRGWISTQCMQFRTKWIHISSATQTSENTTTRYSIKFKLNSK